MKGKIILYTYFDFEEQSKHRKINIHSLYGYDRIVDIFHVINIVHHRGILGIRNIWNLTYTALSNRTAIVYVPHDIRIIWLHVFKKLRIIKNPVRFIVHSSMLPRKEYSNARKVYYYFLRKIIDGTYKELYILGEGIVEDNKAYFRKFEVTNLQWGMPQILFKKSNMDYHLFFAGNNNRDVNLLSMFMQDSDYSLLTTNKGVKGALKNVHHVDINNDGLDQMRLLELMNRCACVLIPLRLDSDQVLGASVLVEALSLQKPVVTTRQGAKLFDVEEKGVGFYYEMGDLASFVLAVERSLALSKSLEFMSKCAALNRDYSYSQFSRNILSVLDA